MSTQEIQDYKLNWLRKKCFKVKLAEVSGEDCMSWLQENIEEKVWDFTMNPQNNQYTFFFENPQDAEKLREKFQGDSRTVDVS